MAQSKKKSGQTAPAPIPPAPHIEAFAGSAEPLGVGAQESIASTTSTTRTRGNKSAYIERTNRFSNIDDGIIPFKNSGSTSNTSTVDVRDAVILCQKAYYNFAVFRSTIDLMTEFSVGEVFLEGGTKKSRSFFNALFKKINLWNFQDQFFREYYRSGNVFIYRLDYNIQRSDFSKFARAFGTPLLSAEVSKIPAKYIILNPSDIETSGNISFSSATYQKVLGDYELTRLRHPKTQEDRDVLKSLPPESRKMLEKGNSQVAIVLDPSKTYAVFYKKQDYEPFSVPLGFPVLEDLNYKKELRKMDMAISRTVQQAVLLITTGAKKEEGGVNPKNLKTIQKIFENESVGRVLIADYTTEAKFVIPQIGDILDPKKYEVLDRDIREGLGNILISEEKFSNSKIKLQVFTQKLNESRKAFLRDFLTPEIKRISEELGFKGYPTPYIQDIDLTDLAISGRIYNRLIELGVLTPEEGIEVFETGKLPNPDESKESQEKFKKLRESGLYQPLIGGPQEKDANGNPKPNSPSPKAGRPGGSSGVPQTETTRAEKQFSMKKVVAAVGKFEILENLVRTELRVKHGKKRLSNHQIEFAGQLSEMIARNSESVDEWNKEKVKDFISNPVDRKEFYEIDEIAAAHGTDMKLATFLYLSKADECLEQE
tara:strand:- start:12895 stop:14856 length:1962 start_codon:yes stop_codon:yes gene_type:complete